MPVIRAERTEPLAAAEPAALGMTGLPSGQLLLWWFLATVTMLFAAFASAYFVRQGGTDWQRVNLPGVVWVNTAILGISSVTLETARRKGSVRWLAVSSFLGVLFLAGQVAAWHELVARGVLLPSTPHASFFYILTGIHGLHLLGGLVYLGRALVRRPTDLRGVATYWHFLAVVWMFVLILLVKL